MKSGGNQKATNNFDQVTHAA